MLRTEAGTPIRWQCSVCADEGVIRNWEDSAFDLRRGQLTLAEAASEVVIPTEVAAALRGLQLLDADCERLVFAIRAHSDHAIAQHWSPAASGSAAARARDNTPRPSADMVILGRQAVACTLKVPFGLARAEARLTTWRSGTFRIVMLLVVATLLAGLLVISSAVRAFASSGPVGSPPATNCGVLTICGGTAEDPWQLELDNDGQPQDPQYPACAAATLLAQTNNLAYDYFDSPADVGLLAQLVYGGDVTLVYTDFYRYANGSVDPSYLIYVTNSPCADSGFFGITDPSTPVNVMYASYDSDAPIGQVCSDNSYIPPGQVCGATTLIYSPPGGSTFALTDPNYVTPQPGPNDAAPPNRSIMVAGTTQCAGPVTVNGESAPVNGGQWQVNLPAPKPGQFTITASAPGCSQAVSTSTLINLDITSPVEKAELPMSAEPAMPDLAASVHVDGYSGATAGVQFNWNLQVRGEEVYARSGKKGRWAEYAVDVAKGSQTGAATPWQPADPVLVGGWGRLAVQATLPGVLDNPVVSDPRWINIEGANPVKSAIESYIDEQADGLADAIKHIDCHETGGTFHQFRTSADELEPVTTSVPAELTPNPAPLRPLYGPPAGVGITQLDPAQFPGQQWDWKANVLGGIRLFQSDYHAAQQVGQKTQAKLDKQRAAVLASVNQARAAQGLPPVTADRVLVPDLTTDQLEREAIRRYNGGTEYRFDASYVAGRGGLTVSIAGSREWVQVKHAKNPNYVERVLSCKV